MLLDFIYDELGRPVDIQYPDDSTIVHYEYAGAYLSGVCEVPSLGDDCTHANATDYVDSVAYDGLGRRTNVTAPSGTRTYQYDPVTYRLTQDAFAGASANYGRTLDYEYDGMGNLNKIKTPSGPAQDPAIDFAATYTYDSRNRLNSWEHGGTTHGYDYDALGNLTHHESATANQVFAHATKPNAITSRPNTDPALDKTYTYDADGNLISEVTASGVERHYTFDGQNRLTRVGTTAGAFDTRIVSYDAAGTRIRDRDPTTNTDRFFADDYFILDVDVAGDADTSAELRIFAEGQQIARKIINYPMLRAEPLLVVPWPRLEIRPTSQGVALAVTLGALLLLLGWSFAAGEARHEPVSALLASGLAFALIFPPGIAFGGGGGSSAERQWFLNDHLGSANAWISEDGYGVMRVVYTPFGKVHEESSVGVNRIFAGHPVDDATGLHYMKARWSNAETGTFLSIDPVVASQTDPQSYNAYAYARNNPIALVDPDGRAWMASAGSVVPGIGRADGSGAGDSDSEKDKQDAKRSDQQRAKRIAVAKAAKAAKRNAEAAEKAEVPAAGDDGASQGNAGAAGDTSRQVHPAITVSERVPVEVGSGETGAGYRGFGVEIPDVDDSVGVAVTPTGAGPVIGTIEITEATAGGPITVRAPINIPPALSLFPDAARGSTHTFLSPTLSPRTVLVAVRVRIGSASITVTTVRSRVGVVPYIGNIASTR